MVAPGTILAILLNAAVLVIAGLLAVIYRDRLLGFVRADPDRAPDEWYGEAADLAREAAAAAGIDDGVVDPDEVRRRLLPIAARLEGLHRRTPPDVDDDVVQRLYELSTECRVIGLERADRDAIRVGDFIDDDLERVETIARELAGSIEERR